MIKQVGWYNPGSKRICYLDEKETQPNNHRPYTIPVYAVACDLCKKHPCTCPKR